MLDNSTRDPKSFAAMQSRSPVATYKKAILGQVCISYLDPFSGKEVMMLMTGDPVKGEEGCFFDVWSVPEQLYFEHINKRHFDAGVLLKSKREVVVEDKKVEQSTDNELRELINKPYFSLTKALAEITSEAVVMRMINLAQEMEKSDKIVRALEAKLSELQLK